MASAPSSEPSVIDMILKCNTSNLGEKGIGDDTDNVNPDTEIESDTTEITYYQVKNGEVNEFPMTYRIGGEDVVHNFNFRIVKFNLKQKGKKLFVLPGFSSTSLCWTVGRINRFKNIIREKGFGEIYIFEFMNVKDIMGKLKGNFLFNKDQTKEEQQTNYNKFYNSVAILVDKIIRSSINEGEKVSILGRSAGGGIAIFLFELHNDYINGLNLAAPGYDSTGLSVGVIDKINRVKPSIRLSISIKDKKVPDRETDAMNLILKDLGLNYKYIKIVDTPDATRGEEGSETRKLHHDAINHRIHEALVNELV